MESRENNHTDTARVLFEDLVGPVSAIESATVAILGIQNDQIVHDRTGVLYRIGDEHFILTASHNIQTIIQNQIPCCVSLNAKRTLPIPLNAPMLVLGTETELRDIAAIRLTKEVAAKIADHKRFISHNEVKVDDRHEGWYIVVGYPQAWSVQKVAEDHLYSHPLIYLCRTYNGETSEELKYDPRVHILLSFERKNAHRLDTDAKEELPEPKGISGCGIWCVADQVDGISGAAMHPPALVGIEHFWSGRRQYIQGTRIGYVLQRILDDLPGLRRPMSIAYPRGFRSNRIVVPPWAKA